MKETLVTKGDGYFWLDVLNPSAVELERLALTYGLPATAVQDCLDVEHLPKYERIGGLSFAILRAYDEGCQHEADTVYELTRKIAIFRTDSFLISIHRTEHSYLAGLKQRWSVYVPPIEAVTPTAPALALIWSDLIYAIFNSYERPLDEAFNQLELLEMGVFEAQGAQPFEIKEGYFLKRKASVFKRMIRLTQDQLPKMTHEFAHDAHKTQDLRELADGYYFYSDELMEGANSLLNLYLSLASQRTNEASHRTNEVVRVLTIFSVFLLPLNVLTGIYGMNFEFMPELKWHLGYPMVLFSMVVVIAGIYLWFRRKGWLK